MCLPLEVAHQVLVAKAKVDSDAQTQRFRDARAAVKANKVTPDQLKMVANVKARENAKDKDYSIRPVSGVTDTGILREYLLGNGRTQDADGT